MKILKLVTWYPSIVHIMSNDMDQYTFNFHKDYKSLKLVGAPRFAWRLG
jgi:hypothetical protein